MTRLRALRLAAGASQSVFAARVGISLAAYGPIERGLAKPTPRIARLLEDAFGHSADDLVAEAA